MSNRVKSFVFWIAVGFCLMAIYALDFSPEAHICKAKGGTLYLNGDCAKFTLQIIAKSQIQK